MSWRTAAPPLGILMFYQTVADTLIGTVNELGSIDPPIGEAEATIEEVERWIPLQEAIDAIEQLSAAQGKALDAEREAERAKQAAADARNLADYQRNTDVQEGY